MENAPPSTSKLLTCWEQGLFLPPHERALLLLQVTCPETPFDELAQLSIGQRDGLLLQLRESLFGPRFISHADCPQCGERLELDFDVASILIAVPPPDETQMKLEQNGQCIVFRLPNSLDVAAVVAEPDLLARHRALLARCICAAGGDDFHDRLPNDVAESLEVRMAELDPQANVEIDLSCHECQSRWLAPFDIVSFLWTEINAWAKRTLQDVHLLASSYGWSEREIINMHPVKRQLYLQMVCG